MVLRDKHRAAEPQCTAMASDQPVKKKQRIDAPDLTENEENYELFSNSLEGITQSIDTNAGSPDSGAPSEDAVDCIPNSPANSIQHLQRYPNMPSTSVVHNGIHHPHYPYSIQSVSPFPEYNSFASNSRLLAQDNSSSAEPESVLLEGFTSFQEHLVQQCLCQLNRKSLRKPFSRRIDIAEWPPDKILMFLSNMQLLFDVYLKQNHKGTICSRLMDVCDALVRNEYDWLGEVIELADHRSQFVNFMAGRVVSSFLIVAKDNIDLMWLEKLIENFVFDKNTMNLITVRKINFSLDVIKRIVEWKDMDQHPLEDSAYINTANPISMFPESDSSRADDASTSHSNETNLQSAFSNLNTTNHTSSVQDAHAVSAPCSSSAASRIDTFKLHEPVLKFPVNQPIHCLEYSQNPVPHVTASPLRNDNDGRDISIVDNDSRISGMDELEKGESGLCIMITLTDSESFDTSPIKCLVIRCLEGHWPTLVSNVKQLLTRFLNIPGSENCILSCLSLWENIISVKANLSVVDTKPFYMDLQSFVELLRCTTLPSLIYTQLLSLFNEVLCYGSTLALQDSLPDETCCLAHSIVRFVKDFLLLNNIRLRHSRTGFGFIGLESPLITTYSFADYQSRQIGSSDSSRNMSDFDSSTIRNYRVGSTIGSETDKTMLQKMVLLVLKSVAVTVKEMRCDSSDSSIDDYNAIQEMQMVERSIWDVLKKLDVFLKNALDFLPDSPFTKILIHLFSEQDDYLIESMVCTLDIIVGIVYGNSVFPDLIPMLNPILTFIEFLKVVSHDSNVLLDYLVSNETCFLLYLLRFLKYVRRNWSKFVACHQELNTSSSDLERTMTVLTRLRLQISKLVARDLFPYNISPVLRLLENCESLYEGNELS